MVGSFDPASPVLTADDLRDGLSRALDGGLQRKHVALLGSTGSIGTQSLDIAREYPDYFEVVSLAAGSNVDLLAQQARPALLSSHPHPLLRTREAAALPMSRPHAHRSPMPEIVAGPEGQTAVATAPGADTVVTGVVGCAGLLPTPPSPGPLQETLIAGGPAILPLLKKHGAKMTPADSEHSARTLPSAPPLRPSPPHLPSAPPLRRSPPPPTPRALRRVILTASGGAFRDFSAAELRKLNAEQPDRAPSPVGAKITVDSATMMNKGLEARARTRVIEAHYLFGAGYDDIDIVVHPQSIIHSAVETADSSVIAQLGWPDMRLPILYAMSWPHRVHKFDLVKLGSMSFKAPDTDKYPCIELAYAAGRKGGSMTCALNAANEKANELFREGDATGPPRRAPPPLTRALPPPQVIEQTMAAHERDFKLDPSLEDIIATDEWARQQVVEEAARLAKAPVLL
ncbi:1-deoxy-D-xylulose 5-phosphate reductoisomerase [Emiliania huxleyi CCMP1516]|uniref:1-deoxy-D-xylulose-5-phosphate reductoisomerase n=2 Tax=Emiliania huxleyi TaxID=2903 RepID=A0A0D3I881_EMIH1|nr:1-deoxy-D-xylulose 5-phosphate reductoisomerase [Emiliania huxleyi CCMP1516]EOD07466.1 1-deoxy-D-xylulose 5-phosphate reductoisomerase [Emiliania huxleyi CCMP1516]|eukprot:XP_005759895.1 1-deoxy-D-xylulose 5-phosphate reductoisomerase [Emiliania huxleyi CCMP1516]